LRGRADASALFLVWEGDIMPKPKEIAKRGASSGTDKLKEQVKDIGGRDDSLESYGGDKLEEGSIYVADKAKDTARDVGSRVKNRVENKIKDKLSEKRDIEEARDVHEPERSPREVEREPDARTDERVKSRESSEQQRHDTPSEHNIKQRPETDGGKRIKTKEEYVRSQGDGFEQPKELHRQNPDMNKAEHLHTQKPASQQPSAPKAEPDFSVKMKANRHYPRPASNAVQQTAKGSIKTAQKGAVKTAQKGTVKTAQATVKTSKTAVKTAERTAKTTAKAAKTTAKAAQQAAKAAAQAAKAAAKAAVQAAKVAAKAVATALKAIIAAVKGLIAAIAAGGWVAVVIILAIALVAVILCACFGVFASNETEDGTKPMTAAILEIDAGFKSGIDAKIAELSEGDYEEVTVEYVGDMDGDSSFLINWNDVIATYAVRVTMDDTNPTDVVEITPEKIEILKQTFADMNTVSYETEVIETDEIVENEDGEEETIIHRKLIIHVDVKSMDYLAAADLYAFDDTKREALEAMMEPRMLALYAELIGVDVYGGADLTKIIGNLPVGTMGSEVVKLALSKVGAPYVLGAKGPSKFDCSGLVYWTIKELDPELGRKLYTSAGYQFKYCRDNNFLVGEAELQPGDLIFWQKPSCSCGKKYNEIHHTGIWLGDGMIVDASSSNGRVIVRKLFDGSSYKVYAYARPYSY
jgi:hypothetical protein